MRTAQSMGDEQALRDQSRVFKDTAKRVLFAPKSGGTAGK